MHSNYINSHSLLSLSPWRRSPAPHASFVSARSAVNRFLPFKCAFLLGSYKFRTFGVWVACSGCIYSGSTSILSPRVATSCWDPSEEEIATDRWRSEFTTRFKRVLTMENDVKTYLDLSSVVSMRVSPDSATPNRQLVRYALVCFS